MPFRRGGAKKRRDANEAGIVAALEAVGARCFQISGAGLPDILIYRQRRFYAVEIKTAKGRLTAAQQDIPWPVVRSVEDALRAVGAASKPPTRVTPNVWVRCAACGKEVQKNGPEWCMTQRRDYCRPCGFAI